MLLINQKQDIKYKKHFGLDRYFCISTELCNPFAQLRFYFAHKQTIKTKNMDKNQIKQQVKELLDADTASLNMKIPIALGKTEDRRIYYKDLTRLLIY